MPRFYPGVAFLCLRSNLQSEPTPVEEREALSMSKRSDWKQWDKNRPTRKFLKPKAQKKPRIKLTPEEWKAWKAWSKVDRQRKKRENQSRMRDLLLQSKRLKTHREAGQSSATGQPLPPGGPVDGRCPERVRELNNRQT